MVHWAVNPENAIFESVLNFCATRRVGFTITVDSNYSKPRVWSLKTVRAASVNPSWRDETPHADENSMYSYMIVPDWVSFDVAQYDESMCDGVPTKWSSTGVGIKIRLFFLSKMNVGQFA